MSNSCECGGNCGSDKAKIEDHFCCQDKNKIDRSLEKLEKLKQAIADIGFNVEETEEGIRIS